MLIVQAISLIIFFAGIYRGFGISNSTETLKTVEPGTALYFSVVTWTTLGYGDYSPLQEIQLIAAFQAMLGYIFLGLIVAILAAILSARRQEEGRN